MHPANKRRNIMARVLRARKFPHNTCPASRHVALIGEMLVGGKPYPMIEEEPEHVGLSLLSVVESLWKARTRIAELEKKLAKRAP